MTEGYYTVSQFLLNRGSCVAELAAECELGPAQWLHMGGRQENPAALKGWQHKGI